MPHKIKPAVCDNEIHLLIKCQVFEQAGLAGDNYLNMARSKHCSLYSA